MSRRKAIIVAVAVLFCLALLGSAPLTEPPTNSSGGYRLASSPWQVEGTTGGSGYLLQAQSYLLQGSPCCCVYLPCTMRKTP